MKNARRMRIGIALGADNVVAAWHAGGSVRTLHVPLELPPDARDATAALSSAFRELASKFVEATGQPAEGVRVCIALLPPLVESRLVPLPPLRPAETLAILRRDAGRHFVGGTAARVLAAQRGGHGAPVLATAAPAALVESIRAAALQLGWRIHAITAAHAAWLAFVDAQGLVVAVDGDTAHVLRSESGAVTVLRRVPTEETAELVSAAGTGPGRALVLAEPATRGELSRLLASAQWTLDETTATAAEHAALHAWDAGFELVPDSLAAERRQRDRTNAKRMAAAAVLLVVAAAGVELWGERRELDTLRARRAEIRADVAPLLSARDSLDRLEQRISEIGALADAAPRWTHALFELAMLLPADAHITSLNASGDTLEVEAAGARAGAALQALRSAGSLRDVRLLGTVQRELEDGSTSVERFRLTARIAPAASPTLQAPSLAPPARPQDVRDVAARRTP